MCIERRISFAALAILCLLPASVSAATSSADTPRFSLDTTSLADGTHVYGFVQDSRNHHAIEGAFVRFGPLPDGPGAFTDETGRFTISNIDPLQYPAGSYDLFVDSPVRGYGNTSLSVTTIAGQSVAVTAYLETRVVILLHGFGFGSEVWTSSWGDFDFPSFLENGGYHVPPLPNFLNSCDQAASLARAFEQYWRGVLDEEKVWSFSLVAYSAGGIVARRSLVPDKGDVVNKFIMLGTPNHGTNIGKFFQWLPLRSLAIAVTCEWNNNTGMINELLPGSSFLNNLNYGKSKVEEEEGWSGPCTDHDDEHLYGLNENLVYSIGGTSPCSEGMTTAYPFECGANDGVISTASAYLAKIPPSNFWLDTELRDEAGQVVHADHALSECSLTRNEGIALAVRDILDGTPPAHAKSENSFQRLDLASPKHFLPLICGEVEEATDFIDSTAVSPASTVMFQCFWSADPLAYSLETPAGLVVDPSLAATDPMITYEANEYVARYVIENPATGVWRHRVSTQTSAGPDSLWLLASQDTDIILNGSVSTGIAPLDDLLCFATFTSDGAPVTDSQVLCTIETPSGARNEIALFDDGLGIDAAADDGIYSAAFSSTDEAGNYRCDFVGRTEIADLGTVERSAIQTSTVRSLPNVKVAADGLLVDDPDLWLGQETEISCTFENDGVTAADSVKLQIRSISPAFVVAESTLTILPGAQVTLSGNWHSSVLGQVNLSATAEVLGSQDESLYADNVGSAVVTIGYPTGGITAVGDGGTNTDPDVPGAEAGAAYLQTYPNPFNPTVSLRFLTYKDHSHVALRIYDVRGTLVRTLLEEWLPAGTHIATWAGRDQSGASVASGVYFCRLDVDGTTHLQKMTVLK